MTRTRWIPALLFVLAAVSTSPAAQEDRAGRYPRIFEALGLRPGAVVADVGAGQGDYTFRMADLVEPGGRVLAVDISPRSLEQLRALVAYREIENVEVIEGAVDDPRLPPGTLDAVLIVNAYHEMVEHEAMLAGIRSALQPDGRLVIVDQVSGDRRDASRAAQTERHEIAPGFVREDLRVAGFREVSFTGDFWSHEDHREWLIVASPDPEAVVPAAASDGPRPASTPAALRNAEADAAGLRIAQDEFLRLQETGRVIVLDTRVPESFAKGHVPGAKSAPMSALGDLVEELEASGRPIVAYCDCPAEETSLRAVTYLRERGVTNVRALIGGWEWWAASGRPIER